MTFGVASCSYNDEKHHQYSQCKANQINPNESSTCLSQDGTRCKIEGYVTDDHSTITMVVIDQIIEDTISIRSLLTPFLLFLNDFEKNAGEQTSFVLILYSFVLERCESDIISSVYLRWYTFLSFHYAFPLWWFLIFAMWFSYFHLCDFVYHFICGYLIMRDL